MLYLHTYIIHTISYSYYTVSISIHCTYVQKFHTVAVCLNICSIICFIFSISILYIRTLYYMALCVHIYTQHCTMSSHILYCVLYLTNYKWSSILPNLMPISTSQLEAQLEFTSSDDSSDFTAEGATTIWLLLNAPVCEVSLGKHAHCRYYTQ